MSDLVGNPEDRFSQNEAHLVYCKSFMTEYWDDHVIDTHSCYFQLDLAANQSFWKFCRRNFVVCFFGAHFLMLQFSDSSCRYFSKFLGTDNT